MFVVQTLKLTYFYLSCVCVSVQCYCVTKNNCFSLVLSKVVRLITKSYSQKEFI